MAHASELIATDIQAYLAEHERKDLLRFLTCGSVDDGKSTLIGRLLHDSNLIYEDHLRALEADSAVSGTTGDRLDLALLMDGLKAEREQGITIDVAWRYFSTARRKFIIADTPGHLQYTRNMVTGASSCQLAVILIDARRGVLEQTRRHAYLTALLGIRHVAVAINKMDLVAWSRDRFEELVHDYRTATANLDVDDVLFLPISALEGDNVVSLSPRMSWYRGPALIEHLETVDVRADVDLERLRFPVQLVQRPHPDFRGFAGTVAAGALRPGLDVLALPSGVATTVERVVTFDGDLEEALPGQAVTVTLTDEIDLSRGDVLVDARHPMERAHQLDAMVVWMHPEPLDLGRQVLLSCVNGTSNVSLTAIRHRVDMRTLAEVPAERLGLNDVARCTLAADRELLFDPYEINPTTGSFVLIDRRTNVTVGAGMILRGAGHWDDVPPDGVLRHDSSITEQERVERYQQRPCVVLLTGMTGAGKTTIGRALERRLFDLGYTALRLDGENLRLGISRDLGFSNEDRSESLRRAAEIAAVASRQGLLTIIAIQAPEAEVRERARDLIGHHRFVEVHVDAPEHVRRSRDTEGRYASADRGENPYVPGVTSTYDVPAAPDLHFDTSEVALQACVDRIVELLSERGYLGWGR